MSITLAVTGMTKIWTSGDQWDPATLAMTRTRDLGGPVGGSFFEGEEHAADGGTESGRHARARPRADELSPVLVVVESASHKRPSAVSGNECQWQSVTVNALGTVS